MVTSGIFWSGQRTPAGFLRQIEQTTFNPIVELLRC